MSPQSPIRKNRAWWEASSADYQGTHGECIETEALAWGVWRIPEAELRVLGALRGQRVLELGCGGGQWATALLRDGVRAIGIDLTAAQLADARKRAARLGTAAPFVQGDAETLPFRSEAFDVVFCDHGATSFTRPERSVPEAARVLAPGGTLAFCMSSPIRDLCWRASDDTISPSLERDYFSMHTLEDDDLVCFQLPYGAWIRLFRSHGLEVEDLVELEPPPAATTTYGDYAPVEWARRWPAENIWKLRKRA